MFTLSQGCVGGPTTLLETGSRQAALSLGQEVGREGQGGSGRQQGSTFGPRSQKR